MKKLIIVLMLVTLVTIGLMADDEKKITPYGFVKLDAIYETGSSYPGNYVFWAQDPGEADGLFHLTANQTRLGLNIKGISFANFKVTGKVEIDFYGGNAENKAYNFMRKAYLEISNGTFSLLAGQNSDIISPLVPSTLNYTVLWGAGNIGYRRPQVRIKNKFKVGNNTVTVEAGVVRTIGDGLNGGIALGIPTFQGRCSGKFMMGKSNLQLGVSAHYGESKAAYGQSFSSNSFNVDFSLAISSKLKILGEYFVGNNMGKYLGGILQTVNAEGREIDAAGFWVNLVAAPVKNWQLSLGYGIDDPDDKDLDDGGRSKNSAIFGNLVISLSPSLKVGVEISQWQTDYLTMSQQKTLRIQGSMILAL